jgi:hypothetical protein
VIAVNMETGQAQAVQGSWGGASPFSGNALAAAVQSGKGVPVAPGVMWIQLQTGGGRPVSASACVHPASMAPLLPAPAPALAFEETAVLYAHRALKSAARRDYYRSPYYSLGGGAPDAIEPERWIPGLVAKGLLKQNSAGATQITTEGRNAIAHLGLSEPRPERYLPEHCVKRS